jgi:hypothetical protein
MTPVSRPMLSCLAPGLAQVLREHVSCMKAAGRLIAATQFSNSQFPEKANTRKPPEQHKSSSSQVWATLGHRCGPQSALAIMQNLFVSNAALIES